MKEEFSLVVSLENIKYEGIQVDVGVKVIASLDEAMIFISAEDRNPYIL